MRPLRTVALALLAALLVGSSAGCADHRAVAAARAAGPTAPPTSAPTVEPAQRRAVEALLVRRQQAVVRHDLAGFLATVAPGPSRLTQQAWFDRISRLPLTTFALQLGTHDPAVTDPDRYRAEVDEVVQLSGFDPAPVTSTHELDFQRTAAGWRVVGDRIDASELNDAPWDFPGTSVAFGDHVAVVLDRGSADHGPQLVAAAEAARAHDNAVILDDVAQLGDVVVLAFSDTRGIRAEGIDPAELPWLGGLALPVRGPRGTVTELRALITPTMLDRDPLSLAVVLRHELAHVALREQTGPRWLTEGIAEYVAWSGEPTVYLSRTAIDQARAVDTVTMPEDRYFSTEDVALHYAVSWFALRALATLAGDDDEPFDLLRATTRLAPSPGVTPSVSQVRDLLEQRYGLDTDTLAHRAAFLISQTFP